MIFNPTIIKKGGGGGELPAFMSAKNFTFDGNACTGYVGDNSLPEIIIPRSYSTVTSIETVVGAKVLDKENLSMYIYDFQSVTFSDGGTNTQTYTSTSQLQNLSTDFPNDCYLVSMQVSDVFNFDFLNLAYDMQMLQFPIAVNGQSFSDGNLAFDYISQNNITNVNFGGDVEIITFIDCDDYQVTSISVSGIYSGFKNYQNRIILLNNLTSIGDWAFCGCSALTSIEIPSSVTSIGSYAFSECENLANIELPGSVANIGEYAFQLCASLKSFTIPEGVVSIGSHCFMNSDKLLSITISKSVTNIGRLLFFGCDSLETIIVEEGNQVYHSAGNCLIETESKTLFAGCKNSVIPSDGSVTSIGISAFQGIDFQGVETISIPEEIETINSSAFSQCKNLPVIKIYAIIPPTLSNTNAISTATTQIQVPMASVDAYKTATNWSNFAEIIVGYTE